MENLKDLFRESMSQLASGVSIVTTELEGRPWGLTISACSSISMEPPLIMISLASNTASAKSIVKQNKFGVNILGSDQTDIAKAGAAQGKAKYFEDSTYLDVESGTYVVRKALSHVSCEVHDTVIAGDHTIFIGAVKKVLNNGSNLPLLFYDRKFGSFSNELIKNN